MRSKLAYCWHQEATVKKRRMTCANSDRSQRKLVTMLRFSLKNVLTVEIVTIKNKKLKDLLHGLEYPARAVLHDPFDAPKFSVKLALIYSALSLLIISR